MVGLNVIVVKKARGDYTMFLFLPPPPPPCRKAKNYPNPPSPPPKRYIREDLKWENYLHPPPPPPPKWPVGPEIIDEAGGCNMYTVERIVVAIVVVAIGVFFVLSAMGII